MPNLKTELDKAVLCLWDLFDIPTTHSDRMQLRRYIELEIFSNKGLDFFVQIDPRYTAIVHYFVINYTPVDIDRVERVLKHRIPNPNLNRELYELRQANVD